MTSHSVNWGIVVSLTENFNFHVELTKKTLQKVNLKKVTYIFSFNISVGNYPCRQIFPPHPVRNCSILFEAHLTGPKFFLMLSPNIV